MNKIALVPILGSMILLAWCFSSNEDGIIWWAKEYITPNYSWTLTSVGVWPEVSWEWNVDYDVLVLRWRSFDNIIHMYVPKTIYEQAFESSDDYLPWNKIELTAGVLEKNPSLWNRYFEVKNVESMKVVGYPTTSEMESMMQSYARCEEDSDCAVIWWICPLECYIWINKNLVETATDIMRWFDSRMGENSCVYDCPFMVKPMCRFNTCMVSYWDDYDIPYYNWDGYEKYPVSCDDVPEECDDFDWVVCWNDGVEYLNRCEACKQWVWTYFDEGC